MFVPVYVQLKRMWRAGMTMSQIADEFGVTRSVISGAISRARAKGHEFAPRPQPPKLPPKRVTVKRSRPKHYSYRPPPPPKPPRLLIDLDWNECLWSVDHAPDDRHLFCGRPKHQNLPYCLEHAKLSYPRMFGDKRTATTCW
jgi:hypothetical protein